MPGVTKVREKAFKGAVSLDGLTAPDVQDIEDSAFSGCGALTSATFRPYTIWATMCLKTVRTERFEPAEAV